MGGSKTTVNIYYFTVSLGQEFGSGLAGWFWLGVLLEGMILELTGVVVVLWTLAWGRRTHLQCGSSTRLLMGSLFFTRCTSAKAA